MMSRDKFVVRLLTDAHELLSWAEVRAEPRPQDRGASCPYWPTGPTSFVIERNGVASTISVHWCDLDVARMQKIIEPTPVQAGQVMTFAWMEPIWLVPGQRDVPLPAVTVRSSVTLVPPRGQLNAVSV